jgi:hypothetical protein
MMTMVRQAGGKTAVSLLSWLVPFGLLWVGALALARLLFEAFFPQLAWLGRPIPAVGVAGITAVFLTLLLQTRLNQAGRAAFLLPLLLNLLYLFDPAVDLVQSRFLFAASLWLCALFAARQWASPRSWRWLGLLFILAALLPIYLLTMPDAVGQDDTFEFQVVAPQLGIAHPTGYPLFLLLGKLFSYLPLNSVAWRLNFAVMVYGLAALSLLFLLGWRMGGKGETAVLAAVVLGLTPVFWSQAIEAEVYTLHALIVVEALFLMREIGGWRGSGGAGERGSRGAGEMGSGGDGERHPLRSPAPLLLCFLLGLGLTNHLTTVFLLPAAALTLFFNRQSSIVNRQSLISTLQSLLLLAIAFALPLLLYAYLPIRWAALHGEPMGLARFADWVMGGRFQGALQWRAWLDDPTRYEVIGRILLGNWGWVNLALAAVGLLVAFRRDWRMALTLLTIWLGVIFYGLNYYVPDLDVFLMGAMVVTAVFWHIGIEKMVNRQWSIVNRQRRTRSLTIDNWQLTIDNSLLLLLILPTLLAAVANWPTIDQSADDGLLPWGEGVLALPLAEGAAILADSQKIAPLYYLQQAEGVRPDLDIMVLPDEAAYRAELNGRLAANQPVYLARFLPGLEGIYHLRSLGPLTEVSREPLTALPDGLTTSDLTLGPLRLLAYRLEPAAAVDPTQLALTLYWQTNQPTNQPLHLYLRLGDYRSSGQHPADNNYPTNAWKGDEIVSDFHLLPRPILDEAARLPLQIALAPPFTPSDELDWQTIAEVDFPATELHDLPRPYRLQLGETAVLSAAFPGQIRPGQRLPVLLSGYGDPSGIEVVLGETAVISQPPPITARQLLPDDEPFTLARWVMGEGENGRYQLSLTRPGHTLLCGWLQPPTASCSLGEVIVSGAPLPEDAINFDDKIALLDLTIADKTLQPGGQLPLTLTWQGLAPLDQDYTVFLQVLDAQDRLVGQVDAWPLQGTLPTSRWSPGQTITDPYTIQLAPDLPPGDYRLLVGWYLLADLRRLPLLNADGAPVDDKLVVPGFVVAGEN